ncbi:MAG: hypothetical protein V4481_02385 [Patescibacteria group bacterium]
MTFNFKNIGKIFVTLAAAAMLMVVFVTGEPTQVHAQISCQAAEAMSQGQSAQQSATNVPTTNANEESSVFQNKQVDCLFKGLAQSIAKVALQQMTSEIVNWINRGFEGNPGFLTNPEAFFLQGADAIAGEFLSKGGPLSQLCSPFSLDIRLSLSLNMQKYPRKQYACTLSTIINNVTNPRLSINGQSIDGFMSGDFRQGGWPAFIEMSTNPANNVYGAYMIADGDLRAQVAGNQAKIQADLTLGNGFMSWQSCTPLKTYSPDSKEAGPYASTNLPPGTRTKRNSDGSITYEQCKTETPGSVIGSSLNKQLGSSVDEIVSIHDIDQAVSTIAQTLIMKTLQTGLAAASSPGSASRGAGSLTDELARDKSAEQLQNKQENLFATLSEAMTNTASYAALRSQTVEVLTAGRNAYSAPRACYVAIGNTVEITKIDRDINKADKEIGQATKKIDFSTTTISTLLADMNAFQDRLWAATSTAQIKSLANEQGKLLGRDGVVSTREFRGATRDLDTARAQSATWQKEATDYSTACAAATAALATPAPTP